MEKKVIWTHGQLVDAVGKVVCEENEVHGQFADEPLHFNRWKWLPESDVAARIARNLDWDLHCKVSSTGADLQMWVDGNERCLVEVKCGPVAGAGGNAGCQGVQGFHVDVKDFKDSSVCFHLVLFLPKMLVGFGDRVHGRGSFWSPKVSLAARWYDAVNIPGGLPSVLCEPILSGVAERRRLGNGKGLHWRLCEGVMSGMAEVRPWNVAVKRSIVGSPGDWRWAVVWTKGDE